MCYFLVEDGTVGYYMYPCVNTELCPVLFVHVLSLDKPGCILWFMVDGVYKLYSSSLSLWNTYLVLR
jgi:hypothetical protein